MDIYSSASRLPHVPYFYIIQHLPSGKLYAGSKWGKGCHPDKFMTKGGYQTSSNLVKTLIKRDGLDSFAIIQLRISSSCNDDVFEFESRFLRENKIAQRSNWLNCHNNEGFFDRKNFSALMKDKFGVDSPMLSEICKNNHKAAILKKYNVDNISKLQVVKDKKEKINREKHGGICPFNDPEVIEQIKQLHIETLGVDNPFKAEKIKDKIKATNLLLYGFENPAHNQKVKDKTVDSYRKKYGYDHPMQDPNHVAKTMETRKGLSSREIVKHIREYASRFKIKLGCGWYQKSDDKLQITLDDLKLRFGLLV